jgi:hypothetical protein
MKKNSSTGRIMRLAMALLLLTIGVGNVMGQTTLVSYGFETDEFGSAEQTDKWLKNNLYSSSGIGTTSHVDKKGFSFNPGGSTAPNPQTIISPLFESSSNITVSLYYKATTNTSTQRIRIGVSTSADRDLNDNSWTWDDYQSITNTSWDLLSYSPSTSGVQCIAIQYDKNGTNYTQGYIDDISVTVTTVVSCTKPTDLSASATTSTTADVSWTAGGDEEEWTLEYSTDADFSVPANITTEDITTTSKELTGLHDNTTYYVRVKAVCGVGDESDWTDVVNFKTNSIEAIPYKYCFEDDGDHDTISEWTLRDAQSGTGITTGGVTGNTFKFLGKHGNVYTQYLISPELSNTSNGLQVTISYYGPVANGNITLNVGYSSTYNTIESFTWSNQVAAANSYTSYTVTYPANTQYIAFKAYTNGTGYVYIDNIKLSVPTHTTENGDWNNPDTWSNGEVPTASSNLLISNNLTIPSGCNATVNSILIDGGTLTIANGGKLTLSSCTNGGTAANIIIQDGGQLICNNSVAATVQKSIEASDAPTSKGAGWYTISSPVNNAAIASVTNLIVTDTYEYDLYRFNETKDDSDEEHFRWENYKNSAYSSDFVNFENGRGYIYRKNNNDAIAFVGNTNVGSVPYALTCSDVPELAGFNLIGNPYPHSITKGISKAIYDSKLSTGYYILSNHDTWYPCADGDEIPAKQGILVKTSVSLPSFTISDITYTPPAKSNNDNIRFSVKNEQFEDVAYAWFDKGYGLPKIAHRNPSAPMLYIPQDGTNYATAIMDDNTETFGLNLKAMTMGKYTLSATTSGDYSYLHLIDRLTGEDVDMLIEGEYSFIATPNDSDSRFIVRLSYKAGNTVESDNFAYQTGNEIIVSGEGELQIFDVTGRKVMTTTINGVEAISGLNTGVYIFRMVGNDVKTQKIVVR